MDDAIYTHPKNVSILGEISGKLWNNSLGYPVSGLPIYTDKNIPVTQPTGKVKFPTDGNWRFCEFEEKDAEWAVPLGIAEREEEPVFYMMEQSKYPNYFKPFKPMEITIDIDLDLDVMKDIQERLRRKIEEEFYSNITKITKYFYPNLLTNFGAL
jgi:hypothetical protein